MGLGEPERSVSVTVASGLGAFVRLFGGLRERGGVRAHALTFSWKTKQDSRAVACSTVRSLKRPLKIISVSRSSSPLETQTRRVTDW